MPYSAMPSRLMPIDADGTVVGQSLDSGGSPSPVSSYPSGAVVIAWASQGGGAGGQSSGSIVFRTHFFFPEARTILGGIFGHLLANLLEGSNDTTNGADGTWETASWPSGIGNTFGVTSTSWRTDVKPATFTGSKRVGRLRVAIDAGNTQITGTHIYGVKGSGQTPDDVLFLDGDIAFAEYATDKDFGDRPLGTTVVKQFKLKNSSTTLTANAIVVTCNDADFAISNDGVTYGTTFTVTSLGAGVSSAVFYIRNTTPSPGAALGPRMVRLSAAVASYS